MKKLTLLAFILLFSISLTAQNRYKYVIIPTSIPEIKSGFNPYQLSTSMQRTLFEKNIKSVFKSSERTFDICDALEINIIKTSSMFTNKIKVQLIDCEDKIIWENEGAGTSKDFREGYAEAFAEAVKDLDILPENTTKKVNYSEQVLKIEKTVPPEKTESTPISKIDAEKEKQVSINSNENFYHPENLYYNYRYFVDVIEKNDGSKEIIIINGELLGYKNLQKIAQLTASGLDDVYTVKWTNQDGSLSNGLANINDTSLKISFQSDDIKEVISLIKY